MDDDMIVEDYTWVLYLSTLQYSSLFLIHPQVA